MVKVTTSRGMRKAGRNNPLTRKPNNIGQIGGKNQQRRLRQELFKQSPALDAAFHVMEGTMFEKRKPKHSKNEPTLYDNFVTRMNTKQMHVAPYLEEKSDMLLHLRMAQRYVLDEEASHFLGWMVKHAAPLILKEHEFARPPYPDTWIEIDMFAYLEALDGRDSRNDEHADSRIGYLIMQSHILFFVSETPKDKPILTPYWYVLHEPISFEQELELAQKLGLSRLSLREHLLGISGLSPEWYKTEEATNFCRGHHFMLGKSIADQPPHMLRSLLRGAAGSLKQAIALLLLLSRPGSGVITLREQDRRRGIIKGHQRVLVSHHKVTLHLNRDMALKKVVEALHHGGHHRYHAVRGHWCQTRANHGCDHDWQPVDPNHYECIRPGCKAKRWWRKNCHRGDISLGTVTKEYDVTK